MSEPRLRRSSFGSPWPGSPRRPPLHPSYVFRRPTSRVYAPGPSPVPCNSSGARPRTRAGTSLQGPTGQARRRRYDGRATTFVDRGLFDGEEYRYVVVTYDAAGLRSVGVAVIAVPAQPGPQHAETRRSCIEASAADVAARSRRHVLQRAAAPCRSRWLQHEGAQRVAAKNRFQLSRTWRYAGKTQRLSAGTYEWFVWAGLGSRAAQNYSPLLGWSRFTVKPQRASRLWLAHRDDVERCDRPLEALERQLADRLHLDVVLDLGVQALRR